MGIVFHFACLQAFIDSLNESGLEIVQFRGNSQVEDGRSVWHYSRRVHEMIVHGEEPRRKTLEQGGN
jgi:hypothetical protein